MKSLVRPVLTLISLSAVVSLLLLPISGRAARGTAAQSGSGNGAWKHVKRQSLEVPAGLRSAIQEAERRHKRASVQTDGSAYLTPQSAQTLRPVTQQQKLQALDAAAGDQFGHTVSLNGDTAIVGAWQEGNAGRVQAGAAYVFTRSGGVWTQQQKLTASDAAAFDFFGFSVSVSGDTAVIGAVGDDNSGGQGAGSAYIFTRSGGVWTQQQRLQASDGALNDGFGYSVSLSDDTVVIGSVADDNNGQQAGAAYVFTKNGGVWEQQQRLQASDAAEGDNFGHSVSLDGDSVVIGAWHDDNAGGSNAGAAYVFTRSGGVWTQQHKLTASDAAANDSFGVSVSLSDDTAIVGAYGTDNGGDFAGSAYVFTRSDGVWTEQQRLQASDAAADDLFGHSVSMSGYMAVINAPINNNGTGAAYVFTRSGGVWTQQHKLTASDATAGDGFGFSVSLSGDTILAGSYQDDNSGGVDAGAAYVFAAPAANAAPVVNAGPDQPATEDAAFNLTASFTDADASDSHTATIDWGDGSPAEDVTVTEPSGLTPGTVAGAHTYLAPGNYTVTVTVADNAGSSDSDTLHVSVAPAPELLSLTLPEDITAEATSAAGAPVSYEVSSSGGVGGASISCSPASGGTFPLGTTPVTCTAVDEAGNSVSGSFDVTVVDNTAPTLNLPGDITAHASSEAGSVVSYSVSADDAVGVATLSCSPVSGDTFPIGKTAVSCSAADEAGNTSFGGFSVIVADTTAPSLNLPGDLIAEATGPGGAPVTYTASADDAVGVTSFSCDRPSGSTFPLGTTDVACTARDAANNEAGGTFRVTVVDTRPPTISNAPADITVSATSASGAPVSYTNLTASDLVDGAVAVSCAPASGSTFPIGPTVVTCAATDSRNNAAWATFTVTVLTTDLTITTTATPSPLRIRSQLTYTITVSNSGLGNAVGVVVHDTIPDGTDFVSAITSAGTTCSPDAAGVLVCGLGNLASGESATLTLTVFVTAKPKSSISNTASLSAVTYDPDASDNAATVVTPVVGGRPADPGPPPGHGPPEGVPPRGRP